ncbi:MAG: hypothetical protein GVY13_11670 [Alphaproteobacteria bacterium]|nr:hypothetical protein [Alphaproteobacteria bacterium]
MRDGQSQALWHPGMEPGPVGGREAVDVRRNRLSPFTAVVVILGLSGALWALLALVLAALLA